MLTESDLFECCSGERILKVRCTESRVLALLGGSYTE
jgi:hypothetical protein